MDTEFEVIADDIHAVGRDMYRGRRRPTLPMAIIFGLIGLVFWWLGNPIGGAIMVVFGILIYANPRIGFLDRWWARRMPGNRIGSRWRITSGPSGFDYWSEGLSGHVEWEAVDSVIVGNEAIVVMGTHSSPLISIPRRGLTPWQVAAITDLTRTHASDATLIT